MDEVESSKYQFKVWLFINYHGFCFVLDAAGSVNLKLGSMQNYNVDNVSAVNLTYINSNIIVHHQKTKSQSNAPAGRKQSGRHT